MSGLQWSGWAGAAVVAVCAAVGLWHHRRDAARVARCAHELRGSLGALRLGLDLAMARGGLDGERLAALDLQLTRATPALAELEGRGLPRSGERVEPVELGRLARECVAALSPLGASRGVEIEMGEVCDEAVPGSRAALAQALSNLIQNAVEHGAGPVRVQARRSENTVRLEVADHGPGLGRPSSEPHAPGRTWGWVAGTGAHGHGLRVAASVAAAHGGRLLSVPSQSGARLILELPLATTAHTRTVRPGGAQLVWSRSTDS